MSPAKTPTPIERRIQDRVRALRKESGLTLNEVSQRAKLTLDAVAKIEHGRRTPSLSTLLKLASVFGVPPSELFDLREPTLSPSTRMIANALEARPEEVQRAALRVVRALLDAIDSRR